MAGNEPTTASGAAAPTAQSRALVLARLDRLPRQAVSYAATGIVGLAMFVIFYCNFDINVSFLQTCGQIVAGCTPADAQSWLPLPVCASAGVQPATICPHVWRNDTLMSKLQ